MRKPGQSWLEALFKADLQYRSESESDAEDVRCEAGNLERLYPCRKP
jgi:hypothetical protein